MICTVQNIAKAPRIFYDVQGREIKVNPDCWRKADIDDGTYTALSLQSDLIVQREFAVIVEPQPVSSSDKPALSITGHFGIGDNLHQRAVMRELMKTNDVWLHTCHFELYHDLIEQGLKLVIRPTSLHAQARTIERERELFTGRSFPPIPADARKLNIGYPKVLIDQHGSILETMFSCVGMKMPEQPDFRLPIKPEWREKIRGAIKQWNCNGKPLLVHRPIVVRREWDGRSRNPDPAAYDQLFRSIRDRFFVVSLADIRSGEEWIEGPQQEADIKLHKGELSFPEMAALFSEADLVFCNAGFAPVLAQAVSTPVVVVYGGRESYRTTQRVGAHLAPTLPIDPINPCDCHSAHHACDKRIDVPRALAELGKFVDQQLRQSTLIFGTFYVDSPDRSDLTDLWMRLHQTLNPDCDFLAVDSRSPIRKFDDWTPYNGERARRMYFNFPDNIGHLSRKDVTQGRDGWGRAFCKGLEIACELGYDYAVHIEGDSLFRLKVSEITKWMRKENVACASTNVAGLRTPGLESSWVETGLMFFCTKYVRESKFVQRYDWPSRKASPTPERWIRLSILEKDLNAKRFRIMPWKALRADKTQITVNNIESINLDWVTHQHDSAQQGVYQKFVEMALKPKEVVPIGPEIRDVVATPQPGPQLQPQVPLLRLNLGCGTNKLNGWENHDADVDITKRLPWDDSSVGYINIEHCVEHVSYRSAIEFFKEAHRVLAPGGVLRITVPSLEQIAKCEDTSYYRFTTKWQQVGATKRGAMHAIIYAHGHEAAWNARLMRDTLYFAGFDDVRECSPGHSNDPVLRGVEGHGKVIGDKFNLIESCTHEARKGIAALVRPSKDETAIAVVIGGADCWQDDLDAALKLLEGRKVRYYYVNDHIKTFPEPGVACTLHPDKLNGQFAWLVDRRKSGLPEPDEVWAHRRHACVTHDTASVDWQGSSGLFAVQVAKRHGHRKIIGCGIPMTIEANHFLRHQNWQSAMTFRDGWLKHKRDIEQCFRSMSGWTAEKFRKPDLRWLEET
jgi:methyltransferase family protein